MDMEMGVRSAATLNPASVKMASDSVHEVLGLRIVVAQTVRTAVVVRLHVYGLTVACAKSCG